MTTLTIRDISVTQELTDDAAKKTVGGMIPLRDYYDRPIVADPYGGAGHPNPYDGNLLNHPEDDG